MKKNVIMLVIDSFTYDNIINFKGDLFLKKLIKENYSCSNMFSMAPFTEAALMGLIAGQKTLDNGGYLKRFQDTPSTIFEVFHNNGYKVFNNCIQPHMYIDSMLRGIDYPFYDVAPDFNAVYHYRLEYYKDLYKNNKMESKDWDNVIQLMDDFFKNWISFYVSLVNKGEMTSFIENNYKNYDLQSIYEEILSESKKYFQGKKEYIISFFMSSKHNIFKIKNIVENNKIKSDEYREFFCKETKQVYNRIKKTYRKLNKKNNKYNYKEMFGLAKKFIFHPNKSNLKKFGISFLGYRNIYKKRDLKDRFNYNYDAFKNAPSILSHVNHFLDWEKNIDEKYFAYIHVDDIHNPEIFLTYDIEDKDLLHTEIDDINEVLSSFDSNKAGNICYDLAVKYIDRKIEYFYNELDKRNILKDSTFVITADHGFSFYHYPIRNAYVNSFFKENYHIPFIIVDKDLEIKEDNNYHNSFCVPTTLCELQNFEIPQKFYNKSVFNDSGNSYVIFEYVGGGCPDISRRKILYSIFNDEIKFSVSAPLENELKITDIYELYDMKTDIVEKDNKIKKISCYLPKINILLDKLNERHLEIQQTLYKDK